MKGKSKFIFSVFILFCCIGILASFGSQCKFDGCENKRIDNSNYCEKHTCRVENCYKQTTSDVSIYCIEHKCSAMGCLLMKKTNSDYCKNHKEGQLLGGNAEKQETTKQQSSNTSSTNTINHPYSLDKDEKIVLWMEAEEAVKARLKSPSSAKFPFAYNSDGVNFNYDNSTGIATFWGWVEAENDYGATVRKDWMVDFYVEGETYKVTNVEFF